ncbi:hypothetical protein L6452_09527 [Arctium lappa]|uniref:Uncharacterized protein n=1 Tax=Arctium lappa TaxID=4217 RepID=A0ACB9DKI9_ARCLA|nr:hypothetical protein L6452_09527 [Arctium lappa]
MNLVFSNRAGEAGFYCVIGQVFVDAMRNGGVACKDKLLDEETRGCELLAMSAVVDVSCCELLVDGPREDPGRWNWGLTPVIKHIGRLSHVSVEVLEIPVFRIPVVLGVMPIGPSGPGPWENFVGRSSGPLGIKFKVSVRLLEVDEELEIRNDRTAKGKEKA